MRSPRGLNLFAEAKQRPELRHPRGPRYERYHLKDSGQHGFKMPREAEPSLNEKAFVTQALKEHLRLDNRALDEYRPIDLSIGDEYGSAEVKLGKTR